MRVAPNPCPFPFVGVWLLIYALPSCRLKLSKSAARLALRGYGATRWAARRRSIDEQGRMDVIIQSGLLNSSSHCAVHRRRAQYCCVWGGACLRFGRINISIDKRWVVADNREMRVSGFWSGWCSHRDTKC